MYARLGLNLFKRSLHRAATNVEARADESSHVASEDEEKSRKAKIESSSSQFPDHKVIYSFPYIKHLASLNSIKRRFTYFVGAIVPAASGLHLAGVISTDVAVASIFGGLILVVWLHTIGIMCNNQVGFIYLHPDQNKMIISYISYWGRRVNMETCPDDIVPLSDNPRRITDSLYKKICFYSQKQKLKINLKYGYKIDNKSLDYILGL